MKRTHQIDLDRLPLQVERSVEERSEYPCTCIVDPDVDAIEPPRRAFCQREDSVGVGHVGWDCERRATTVANLAHDIVEHIGTAGSENDAGTPAAKA